MKKWLLLLFLFPFVLFAKDKVLDKQENYFLTSTPSKIAPTVNPITGDYSDDAVDLVVAGIEPLSVRRFYLHSAPENKRYGSWRFNPECELVGNLELNRLDHFAAIGSRDGSVTCLKGKASGRYTFKLEEQKGFGQFQPTGQTHPLNTQINYTKKFDPKEKGRFQWMGEVIDGTGSVRTFRSPMHKWVGKIKIKKKKGNFFGGSVETCRVCPETWTPYHLPIYEERKPNGNIICYKYTRWQDDKHYPKPYLIKSITAYNRDKTKILGELTFHYDQTKKGYVKGITIEGSDGRSAFECIKLGSPNQLVSSTREDQPKIAYHTNGQQITRIQHPEGREVVIKYKDNKVSEQHAPIGPNGEMELQYRWNYLSQGTEVWDALGYHTSVYYNENKCVTGHENFKHNHRYSFTRYTWDNTTGNLLKKTLEDKEGTIHHSVEYTYDKNQNPITETHNNDYTIKRTFSDDGFNLLLTESDKEDRITKNTYLPGTNLLIKQLLYEKETIRKRTFHTYDDCAVCTKTIIDDGTGTDPYDLANVTTRKIIVVHPKQTLPCLGLPEVIETKTIDKSGNEILIKKVVITYTPSGKILTEKHFEETDTYTIENTYDERDRLLSTTDPLGHTTHYTYDANHNITSITDSHYKEITYDKMNRPTRIDEHQTDGTILTTQNIYNKLGQLITQIDAGGNQTHMTYDEPGRLTKITYPDGGEEQRDHDIFGNITTKIDPNGYRTTATYNYRQQPLTINHPDGSTEHYSYNPSGTLATHTDKNGATTVYTYDVFDHPIKIQIFSPTGELLKETSATYNAFHKLSETNGNGITTTYTYDYEGKLISQKTAKLETTYNTLGRTHTETTHDQVTTFTYDFKDQLLEKRIEDLNGTLHRQEEFSYDANGNVTSHTTSKGTWTTTYNTHNQPLEITDPLGNTTINTYSPHQKTSTNPKGITTIQTLDACQREIIVEKRDPQTIQKSEKTYDKNGNITQETHTIYQNNTPLKQITHTWEYGPLNRLERMIEANERETIYTYNANGQLETIIKPDGTEIWHTYDALGRLCRYTSTDFHYEYTYDGNDNVTENYDHYTQTTTSRTYNAHNQITCETLSTGLTLCNTYNNVGERTTLTLPDQTEITYSYTCCDLHKVSYLNLTHTYTRDLEGEITQSKLPNHQLLTIERNALSYPTLISSPYYTANTFDYDAIGNLLTYTYTDPLGSDQQTYTYDSLNQLTSENEHDYTYDSLYNRLDKDGLDHMVNNLNEITNDGETTYTYDLNGNLISDDTHAYTYDSQDRLIKVETPQMVATYTYDPYHRRLSKTVTTPTNTTTQLYIWDDQNEIGTTNLNGEISQLRVLGEGFGAEIGAAVLHIIDDQAYIPIHDHQGNLVILVDCETNQPTETYRYTAYGEEITTNHLSPWRFSSKRTDPETGFVYFGRRYYSAKLGRWITTDPQGFDDGPNLYAYLNNGPLSGFDLYGLYGIFSWQESFWRDPGGGSFDYPRSNATYLRAVFDQESMNYDLGHLGRQDLPIGRIQTINGLWNGQDEAMKRAMTLSDYAGGYNVYGTYLASYGMEDPYVAMSNLNNIPTYAVTKLQHQWDSHFDQQPNIPLYQECHSRGTSVVKMGLMSYPEDRRDKIIVGAFAPLAYIDQELCMKVTHYVTKYDPITYLDRAGRKRCASTTVTLKSNPSTCRFFDHAIDSPTFARSRRREIEDYLRFLKNYE